MALTYPGFSLIEVLSPCVAYGNLPSSTKSFPYIKNHNSPLNEIECIYENPNAIQGDSGDELHFHCHDKTYKIKALEKDSFDIRDAAAAINYLTKQKQENVLPTGLLHCKTPSKKTKDMRRSVNLSQLSEAQLRPSPQVLEEILKSFSPCRGDV